VSSAETLLSSERRKILPNSRFEKNGALRKCRLLYIEDCDHGHSLHKKCPIF